MDGARDVGGIRSTMAYRYARGKGTSPALPPDFTLLCSQLRKNREEREWEDYNEPSTVDRESGGLFLLIRSFYGLVSGIYTEC